MAPLHLLLPSSLCALLPSVSSWSYSSFNRPRSPLIVTRGKPNLSSDPRIRPSVLVRTAKPLPWEEETDEGDSGCLKTRLVTQHGDDSPIQISSLAKIAVAFSPPERRITLKDVEHVEVLKVENDHIQLTAVVCDGGQCVTLFVPVSFPSVCTGLMGVEELECVNSNVAALTNQAEAKIVEQDAGDELDRFENDSSLYLTPEVDDSEAMYPGWWMPPNAAGCEMGLADECDLIKGMLNGGEFNQELAQLTMAGLRAFGSTEGDVRPDDLDIEKAVVTSVGPAGFCLRALAKVKQAETEDVFGLLDEDEDGADEKKVIEVSLPFGGDPAMDASTLRAACLGVVATVCPE